jgi:hypothetical protein
MERTNYEDHTQHTLKGRPPLYSSGKSYWLQIKKSGFDSQRYQIFWELVGLERGPFSLVSAIEELLERKSSDSGVERREYGRRDPLRWSHDSLYPQKLALTSPTSSGRSVGIVRRGLRARSFVFSFSFNGNEFSLRIPELYHCTCTCMYEAHPESKFPWSRVQKQNTIAWKYLL